MSVAKGSHCQDTIITMEVVGTSDSQAIGSAPKKRHRCDRSPLVGSMNMFFHTSAETVGMTKKGAMTRMRTTPWPHIG